MNDAKVIEKGEKWSSATVHTIPILFTSFKKAILKFSTSPFYTILRMLMQNIFLSSFHFKIAILRSSTGLHY